MGSVTESTSGSGHRTRAGFVTASVASIVFAWVCLTNSRPAFAGEEVKTLDDLIAKLAHHERQLRNLYVESEWWIEEQSDGQDQWKRTPLYMRLTAWKDGLPKSLARFDVHKHVTEWIDGPIGVPYAQGSYTEAYDGQRAYRVTYESGTPERPIALSEAQIDGGPPKLDHYSMVTGGGFSIFYFFLHKTDSDGRSLSQELREQARLHPDLPVQISTQQLEGTETVCLQMGPKNGVTNLWWFDPRRSYAVLRFHWIVQLPNQPAELAVDMDVRKLTEAAPGIWYPTQAYYRGPRRHQRPRQRQCYQATKVIANDPNFDRSVFSPQIPPAYTVYDTIEGRTYVAAPPIRELEKDLEQAVQEALGTARGSAPPAAPSKSASGPSQLRADSTESPTNAPPTSSSRAWTMPAIVAALIGLCAVSILAHLYRTRPRRMIATLLAACCVAASHAKQATGQVPAVADESMPASMNCGVNAGYVTLRLHGRNVSMEQVAWALGARPRMDRDCSLADLRKLCQDHGLEARGLKVADVETAASLAKAGGPTLIMRAMFGNADNPTYHFGVLIGSRDGVVLIDPPHKPRVVKRSHWKRDHWLGAATGEFLLVSAPGSHGGAAQDQPVLVLESNEIDLGSIAPAATHVEGIIKVRNAGAATLRILKVDGPCVRSSFAGASGDMEIPAGGKGEIKARFDKSRLPAGELNRQVVLHSNDPHSQATKVVFRFTIPDELQAIYDDIRVVPLRLEYGRLTDAELVSAKREIRVFVPMKKFGGIREVQVVASSDLMEVVRVDDGAGPQPKDRKADVRAYSVQWRSSPQDGLFNETLEIRIVALEGEQRQVKVSLRGDVLAGAPMRGK